MSMYQSNLLVLLRFMLLLSSLSMCFLCELISNFPRTNVFIGKCFGRPEPLEPCFEPNRGRWVYKRGLFEPPPGSSDGVSRQ